MVYKIVRNNNYDVYEYLCIIGEKVKKIVLRVSFCYFSKGIFVYFILIICYLILW